jgi:hypothetical protein
MANIPNPTAAAAIRRMLEASGAKGIYSSPFMLLLQQNLTPLKQQASKKLVPTKLRSDVSTHRRSPRFLKNEIRQIENFEVDIAQAFPTHSVAAQNSPAARNAPAVGRQ